MAWSIIGYLPTDSRFAWITLATRSYIEVPVIFNDIPGSYSYATLLDAVKSLGSYITLQDISLPEDYSVSSGYLRISGNFNITPGAVPANAATVINNDERTYITVAGACTYNNTIYGYSTIFGLQTVSPDTLAPLVTAPINRLQVSTRRIYSHIAICIYKDTSNNLVYVPLKISSDLTTADTILANNEYTQAEIQSVLNSILPDPPSQADPYTKILPESTTGGGNGSGEFAGETIGEPATPTVSALNSGFISAYSPSVASLNALASYMWTTDFSTNLAKVFGDNPMGTILGLSTVPVSPTTGASKSVILGNIDTNIAMPPITAQYTKFNCGTITLQPKYGAFLDYEPYTSIDLFLPYIGLVQLSTNDVMDKSIGVVYTVDVLSGACVANVSCGGTIMYTFEGACATQFPVTNNDYSNVFKSAVDAAASIVGAVGGAVAAGMTGNVAGAVGAIADGAAGAANAAMNAHPVVNRSGSMSGSAGLMGIQKPFIVWTTPNMVASNKQNSFIGYPNFITTSLGSLAGYTEVENINLGIAGATADEVAEIKTLLKNGVIL